MESYQNAGDEKSNNKYNYSSQNFSFTINQYIILELINVFNFEQSCFYDKNFKIGNFNHL